MKLKITMAIIAVIAIIGTSVGGFWVAFNFKTLTAKSAIYTTKDLENAYADGVQEGQGNITGLQSQITTLNESIAILSAQKEQKQVQLDAVVQELLNSQLSNDQKQQLINELNNNVYELSQYVAMLNEMIIGLQVENADLQRQVRELIEIRDSLLQAIYAYEQLIAAMPIIEQRFVVTFMFDDTVYSILLVPDGEKVIIESPISTEYTIFLGWSLTLDGALVDLLMWTPDADTVLYAKIVRKYDVTFVYENTTHFYKLATKGDIVTTSAPQSTDRKVFKGWSLNGVDIINPATRQIWEHTTYFAVTKTRYCVDFIVHGETYNTQWVEEGSFATPPTVDVFGYRFDYWKYIGVQINQEMLRIYFDKTFVAKTTAIGYNLPLRTGPSETSPNIIIPANTPSVNMMFYVGYNAFIPPWNDPNIVNVTFSGYINGEYFSGTYAKNYYANIVGMEVWTGGQSVHFDYDIETMLLSIRHTWFYIDSGDGEQFGCKYTIRITGMYYIYRSYP